MAILKITEWSEDPIWVSTDSRNLEAFMSRIGLCTDLQGANLKRISRGVKNGKILQLDNIKPDKAGPLIHTLVSLGAKIKIE